GRSETRLICGGTCWRWDNRCRLCRWGGAVWVAYRSTWREPTWKQGSAAGSVDSPRTAIDAIDPGPTAVLAAPQPLRVSCTPGRIQRKRPAVLHELAHRVGYRGNRAKETLPEIQGRNAQQAARGGPGRRRSVPGPGRGVDVRMPEVRSPGRPPSPCNTQK